MREKKQKPISVWPIAAATVRLSRDGGGRHETVYHQCQPTAAYIGLVGLRASRRWQGRRFCVWGMACSKHQPSGRSRLMETWHSRPRAWARAI